MAVDDHGIEALKKAAELVTPGNKGNTYIKVSDYLALPVLQQINSNINELLLALTGTILTDGTNNLVDQLNTLLVER